MPKIWQLIAGHILLVIGCYLTAWGIYLAPQSSPTPLSIFTRPLFWGLIVILGGLCFIFVPHIMRKGKEEK